MNIQYFFAADVEVEQWGHISIRYCLTDKMIGDFFTNLMGGASF